MPEIELTHPSGRTVVVEVDRIPSDMDAFAAEVFASLGTATAGPGISPTIDTRTQTALKNQKAATGQPGAKTGPSLGFGELGTRLRGIGVTNPGKGQPLGSGDLRRAEDRERFTAPSSRQYLLLEELKGHTARLGKAQRNYDKTPWYDILGKRKWKSEIDAVKARMAVVQDTLATLADYRPATRTIGLSEEQIRGRADLIQGMYEPETPKPESRGTVQEAINRVAGLRPDIFGEDWTPLTPPPPILKEALDKVPVLRKVIPGLLQGIEDTIARVRQGDLRAIPEFFDPSQLPLDPGPNATTEDKIAYAVLNMFAFYGSKGGVPGADIVPGMLYETPRVGITELRAGLRRLLKEEGLNEKQAAAIANMVEKQAVTATERVKAAAPQVETIFSRKEPIVKEKPDAVQVKQTEEVLQDVRTQPGKGEETLPAQEGGAGVRTKGQAEEVTPRNQIHPPLKSPQDAENWLAARGWKRNKNNEWTHNETNARYYIGKHGVVYDLDPLSLQSGWVKIVDFDGRSLKTTKGFLTWEKAKQMADTAIPAEPVGPKVSTPKTEVEPPAEPGAIPGGSTKPEPPPAKPKVEKPKPKPESEGGAIRNEDMARRRFEAGLEDLPEPERQKMSNWAKEAQEKGYDKPEYVRSRAREINENPNAKPLDEVEATGFQMRTQQVSDDLLAASKRGDNNAFSELSGELDEISRATKKSGTAQARAFVARQYGKVRDSAEYNIGRHREFAEQAGKKLTDDEVRAHVELAEEIRKAKDELNAIRKEIAEGKSQLEVTAKDAQNAIDKQRQGKKTVPKTKAEILQKRKNAIERLKKARAKRIIEDGTGFQSGVTIRVLSAEELKAIGDIAWSYVEQGVYEVATIVTRTKEYVAKETGENLDDQHVYQALSPKKEAKTLTADELVAKEVAREERRVKTIAGLLNKLEEAIAGAKPEEVVRKIDPYARAIRKEIDRLNKEWGHRTDKPNIMAEKMRLMEILRGLNEHIKEGTFPTKKGSKPQSPKLEALRKAIKEARLYLDYQKKISDTQAQIDSGVFASSRKERKVQSQRIEAARLKLQALRNIREGMIEAARPQSWQAKTRDIARFNILGWNVISMFDDFASNVFRHIEQNLFSPIDDLVNMVFTGKRRWSLSNYLPSWRPSKIWNEIKTHMQHGTKDILEKAEMRKEIKFKNPWLNKNLGGFMRLGIRLRGLADIGPMSHALNFQARRLAGDIAKAEGLTGDAYMARVDELLDFEEGMTGIPIDEYNKRLMVQAGATEYGLRMIMANDNFITNMKSGAAAVLKSKMGENSELVMLLTDLVVPFPRVFANIVGTTIDYSPVGLARGIKQIASGRKGGLTAFQRAEANRLIRSGLVGTATYFLADYLGGNPEPVYADKGTGAVDLGFMETISTGPYRVFMLRKKLNWIDNNSGWTDKEKQRARQRAWSDVVLDQPFFTGPKAVIGYGPDDPAIWGINAMIRAGMPLSGLSGRTAQAIDPERRRKIKYTPDDLKDWAYYLDIAKRAVMARIPKIREQLPASDEDKPSTTTTTTQTTSDPLLSRPRRGSDPFAPPP